MTILESLRTRWTAFQAQRTAMKKFRLGARLTPADLKSLPLGVRYHHARDRSEPALPRLRRSHYGTALADFIDHLEQLEIDVRRATGFAPASSRQAFLERLGPQLTPVRDGFAVVEPRHPPLIVLIEQMHDTLEALLDTLFHESIHATGAMLHRFERQPENPHEQAYWLEELTAIYGAELLEQHFGVKDARMHRNMLTIAGHYMLLIGNKAAVHEALNQGEQAARFLLGPKAPRWRTIAQAPTTATSPANARFSP